MGTTPIGKGETSDYLIAITIGIKGKLHRNVGPWSTNGNVNPMTKDSIAITKDNVAIGTPRDSGSQSITEDIVNAIAINNNVVQENRSKKKDSVWKGGGSAACGGVLVKSGVNIMTNNNSVVSEGVDTPTEVGGKSIPLVGNVGTGDTSQDRGDGTDGRHTDVEGQCRDPYGDLSAVQKSSDSKDAVSEDNGDGIHITIIGREGSVSKVVYVESFMFIFDLDGFDIFILNFNLKLELKFGLDILTILEDLQSFFAQDVWVDDMLDLFASFVNCMNFVAQDVYVSLQIGISSPVVSVTVSSGPVSMTVGVRVSSSGKNSRYRVPGLSQHCHLSYLHCIPTKGERFWDLVLWGSLPVYPIALVSYLQLILVFRCGGLVGGVVGRGLRFICS